MFMNELILNLIKVNRDKRIITNSIFKLIILSNFAQLSFLMLSINFTCLLCGKAPKFTL